MFIVLVRRAWKFEFFFSLSECIFYLKGKVSITNARWNEKLCYIVTFIGDVIVSKRFFFNHQKLWQSDIKLCFFFLTFRSKYIYVMNISLLIFNDGGFKNICFWNAFERLFMYFVKLNCILYYNYENIL